MTADDKINILVVDDLPDKLLVLETVLEELGAERRHGPLRRRGAAAGAGAGLRRHPARRQHAGHGRLRDGRPDPPAQEVGAHADHLRHRLRDEMHTAQGYSLGAVDYILSPVSPEVLRTKVGVFVDLFRMTRAGEAAGRGARGPGPGAGGAGRGGGGDPPARNSWPRPAPSWPARWTATATAARPGASWPCRSWRDFARRRRSSTPDGAWRHRKRPADRPEAAPAVLRRRRRRERSAVRDGI